MKRSVVVNHSNDNKRINGSHKKRRKCSFQDSYSMIKLKKRRHISSQHNHNVISSCKKRKSKRRCSSHNVSLRTKNEVQKFRKSSSRRYSFINEITLPEWERISPNINRILSDEHTQSGVYAHEVHLIQQELEALLSMAMIRESLFHSKNTDHTNMRIHQHQQAESVYSLKTISNKPLPPLPPLINQRHNGPHLSLDRQVSITPVVHAHVDKTWSDISTYYQNISSNDISAIKNFMEFNQQLEDKIQTFRNEYKNNMLPQINIIQQLNNEKLEDLLDINAVNPLITNYTNRTVIERFQTNLYERIPQISSLYKGSITNSYDGKSSDHYVTRNSSLRCSPRLRRNHRSDLLSMPNCKSHDEHELSSLSKRKRQTRITPMSASSLAQFEEHVQLVRDYLSDQHPIIDENLKSNKRRKASVTLQNDCSADTFESKLSTIISLLHECSTLSYSALKRARLQSSHEQTWQRLNAIENGIESLLEKIETTGDNNDDNNSISTEKIFQSLDHLLKDWTKYEDEFDQQSSQLFDTMN